MIPRYSRPQMAKIWEPENYFRIQLEIEAYACEAQEKLGVIPKGTAKAVRASAAPSTSRASATSSARSTTRRLRF